MAGPKPKAKSGSQLKNLEKKKAKVVEDLTFGLKNKSKSKKVQQQVQQLTKQVKESGLTKADKKVLEEREQRKMEKFLLKQREKELKTIFNAVPKTADEEAAAALAAGAAEGSSGDLNREPTEQELLDALSALAEVEKELLEEESMSLEDLIEKEREKITGGTPVTEESFKRWKQFKLDIQQKEREKEYHEQLELFKKKGYGLSGRALFELDKNMFVDDEAASGVMEKEKVEVDEDLFLSGDEDDEDGDDAANDEEQYDPSTWTGDTPKSQLIALIGKLKLEQPVFENLIQGGGEGFSIKVTLPSHGNKSFAGSKIYPNKKLAEHNSALQALRFLQQNTN